MTRNLAGIVPIAGHKSDIDLPWHHVLMPYDRNKTLIQHAVYNCAMVGCDSVWIVCDDSHQPLVRSIVGEKIEDPVYKHRAHARHASDHKRWIPVFYCSTTTRDQQRRDNISWSAIYGSLLANKTLGGLSKHTAPDRFFVFWPYCKLDSAVLRSVRRQVEKDSIIFTEKGLSVLSDDFLPIVCGIDTIYQLKQHCYDLQVSMSNYKEFNSLQLSTVFSKLINFDYCELEFNYKKVSNWKEYCNFFK